MRNQGPYVSSFGIDRQGITRAREVFWNLPPARLYEEAIGRGEAALACGGALLCSTGPHTGRSPNDKFTVRDPAIDGDIWWGDVNRPFERARFDALLGRVKEHLAPRDLFVFDGYAGADPRYRLPVRIITEYAWHNLFARNMFIREDDGGRLAAFEPGFTVLDAASFQADPGRTDPSDRPTIAPAPARIAAASDLSFTTSSALLFRSRTTVSLLSQVSSSYL